MPRDKSREIREVYQKEKKRFPFVLRWKSSNFTAEKKGRRVLWTKIWSREEIESRLELFNH